MFKKTEVIKNKIYISEYKSCCNFNKVNAK